MKWILNLLGRARRDRELSDEIRAHIEERADDLVESGLSQTEAWQRASREFGNVTLVAESSREVWQWVALESFLRDIRYGLRQMRRAPGFAAVATLTLALGIGANTAIFSVMNAVMLRFLPVPEPQKLVFLNSTVQLGSQSGDGDTSLSEYVFEQLRNQREVFSDLVAFAPLSFQKVSVRYGKEPEEAQANMVSGNFFSGLGVKPAWGRTFTLEDETSHAQFAVLSYGYWSRRFGRDRSILGQALYVKGVAFTIIGVAAPDFAGVENKKASDIWIPLQDRPDLKPWDASPLGDLSLYRPYPSWWCLKTIGRLAPGINEKQALARLGPAFEQAALAGVKDGDNVPDEQPHLYFTSARGIDGLRNEYEEPLTVLMLMVGVVLVIACANITMLLIARNAARQREFSIRLALGGSRSRLFRQLLAESLLLVALGGAVGWLFAVWATRAMAAWARLDVSITPDRRVLLFALGVSLLTGCAFGLAPLRSILRVPAGLAQDAERPGRDCAADIHVPRAAGWRGSIAADALESGESESWHPDHGPAGVWRQPCSKRSFGCRISEVL